MSYCSLSLNKAKYKVSEEGFTLTAALMSVAIVGVGMSAMISMLTFQHKELQSIKEQLVSANIKQFILQTVRDLENCDCHFKPSSYATLRNVNGKLRDANGIDLGPFTIDTTAATIGDINLGSFRSGGCPFTSTSNTIVKTGQLIKGVGQLKTKSVTAKNIVPIVNRNGEYTAELTVDFESSHRALRPAIVDIILSVDASIDPKAATISHCGPKVASAKAAPEGAIYISMGSQTNRLENAGPIYQSSYGIDGLRKENSKKTIDQKSNCYKGTNLWCAGDHGLTQASQCDLTYTGIHVSCPSGYVVYEAKAYNDGSVGAPMLYNTTPSGARSVHCYVRQGNRGGNRSICWSASRKNPYTTLRNCKKAEKTEAALYCPKRSVTPTEPNLYNSSAFKDISTAFPNTYCQVMCIPAK